MPSDEEAWLRRVGSVSTDVRSRLRAFTASTGFEGTDLVVSWLERPGGRAAVVDAFSTCEDAARCSAAALRLLLLAALEAGHAGPRLLLRSLEAGPSSGEAFDLEALASEITPVALTAPDPDAALAATIRWILDPRVPLSSLAALGGTTRLAAASARMERERGAFAERAAIELANAPLLGSASWRETVALEGGARADAFEAIVAAVGARHVAELVASCATQLPREEHGLVLGLLRRLVRDGDARIAPHKGALIAAIRRLAAPGPARDWSAIGLWVLLDRRSALSELQGGLEGPGPLDRGLLDALLREPPAPHERDEWGAGLGWLNRTAFLKGQVIPEALAAWSRHDARAVSHYLTRELNLESLPQGPLAVVVGNLVRAVGADGATALRRLSERPDAIGRRAAIGLEIIGAAPPREIERLCAAWRATGSSGALAAVYNEVIDGLPEGTPFGPWRERLGPPDSEVDGSLWYRSRDGGCRLYLEVGRDDRLRAWSLR